MRDISLPSEALSLPTDKIDYRSTIDTTPNNWDLKPGDIKFIMGKLCIITEINPIEWEDLQ